MTTKKTRKPAIKSKRKSRSLALGTCSAIPFENKDGHIMRLSGKMTLRELLKMGVVEIHLSKPGTPLRPGEWCDASSPNYGRPDTRREPRCLSREVMRKWGDNVRFDFNYGMADRGHNGVNPMWLGRCWGYWIPRGQWNGGRVSRGECCDITVLWLCFWFGVTIWR